MHTIQTLLVDDSPEFLAATREFLALDPAIQVVGSTERGLDAMDQVRALKPDLVLLDLGMNDMNGMEVLRLLSALDKSPRVIILTLYNNPEYQAFAKKLGAAGFISKSDLGVQLMPAIHSLFPTDDSRDG